MRGMAELVDRRDAIDAIAAVDEDAQVAREGRRIAGDGDDPPNPGLRQRSGLCLGARARWVE